MTDDKRRDPRVPSTQQLWCEGQGQRAQARNVSRSGMLVTVQEPLEIGDQFKVKFDGEEGTIEVNMEVMWRDEPATGEMTGMGLRIVGFEKGEDAYERFVQKQLEVHRMHYADEEGNPAEQAKPAATEKRKSSAPAKLPSGKVPAR
jgi:hypothetical protein